MTVSRRTLLMGAVAIPLAPALPAPAAPPAIVDDATLTALAALTPGGLVITEAASHWVNLSEGRFSLRPTAFGS